MAAPMRDTPLDGGHRPRVADSRTTAKADSSNFEYDDNEWDIGIGDLIIDLDADIEKTNEGAAAGSMASTGGGGPAASAKKALAVEHSATVDKGLKMKIKRTKPGTKTSEAKHEIVKSNEQQQQQQQQAAASALAGGQPGPPQPQVQPPQQVQAAGQSASSAQQNGAVDVSAAAAASVSSAGGATSATDKKPAPAAASAASKRGSSGSSGHRRDKARDKHGGGGGGGDKASPKPAAAPVQPAGSPPPAAAAPPAPGPPPSPGAATAQGSAAKPEQTKVAAVVVTPAPAAPQPQDDRCASPPPAKKLKTSNEPKGMLDVCVGTSVGTITEPDCLGPCEPGTSVTLEGIVWHETEGGVLVVNVTWRGKTYVGTLLDCTRHDWAPPRFCDSPTSDLDARTPKGRGKRGRAAASTTPGNDLSNFTETRSSVHSKLRNGGGKGRRAGTGPSATGTASPTPFIPPRPEPNKRKSRTGEEDTPPPAPGKKSRVTATPTLPTAPTSPPASPVLLECPEPNCSKKYKHINGLKYHQSHAHGSADDDDTKDVTSMSENDESSNIEAPSPATPVKSPEKVLEAPATPQKKEETVTTTEVVSQPSTPPSPQTPLPVPPAEITPVVQPTPAPIVEPKSVVKPGVLRFGPQEDFAVGAFAGNKPPTSSVSLPNSASTLTTVRAVSVTIAPSQPQPENTIPTFTNQLTAQVAMSPQQQLPTATPLQPQQLPPQNSHPHPVLAHQNHVQTQPLQPPVQPQQPPQQNKIPQFKVKPTAALMPDDKKVNSNKPQNYKKKTRKSPAGSPHPHPQPEQPVFGLDQSGREEVQSPAYSDISDDAAPVLESEVGDKNKNPADKKTEPGQTMPHSMPQYGMYPFYGQPPYLVPSVQQQVQDGKPKEGDKVSADKTTEKDPKKDPEYQQKMLPQHYYSYGYVPGYTYNMDPSYGAVSMVPEDKLKEERIKESPSPAEHNSKPAAPIPNPIQVPTPGKVKTEPPIKEKHQNENHQILKESIEMKSQMSPYMYSRQPQQQPAHMNHHHHAQAQQQHQQQQQQREEEMRRYYLYPDQQRRKEQQQQAEPQPQKNQTPNKPPPQSPSVKHKEKAPEEKKDKEVKQEGVKPTMETQGPPPPPTSQYAYAIHPSYMQSPHYGALPFDPNHPMYRSMLVPGPYSGSPYLHPQMPRYHAPEDLSRPPQGPTKALDLLQHHANQYYTSHKIHELQERAMKSPTPKTSVASASPSSGTGNGGGGVQTSVTTAGQQGPPTSQAAVLSSGTPGKPPPTDSKESRSPPPQRHVHTHHHTHVGLGYPLYAPPYGAAVLASQQAAAVTVLNPYPPK